MKDIFRKINFDIEKYDINHIQKNVKDMYVVNSRTIKLTTNDDLDLYIITSICKPKKYLTRMDKPITSYYYFQNIHMPHFTDEDLYEELIRFTDPKKRNNKCRSPYFKC